MSRESFPEPSARRGPETGHGIEVRGELDPGRKVEHAPDETTMRLRRMGGVFSSLGSALLERGVITDSHVFLGDLSHAYFRSADDPRVVIHVQGIPSRSNDKEMTIRTNILDYDQMMRERARARGEGYDIIGSETEAILDHERTEELVEIGYSADALLGLLGTRYPKVGMPEDISGK